MIRNIVSASRVASVT